GHMGAHSLAFGTRGSFPRAPFEFGNHRRILNRRRIDVTNAGFRHWQFFLRKCHRAPASEAMLLVLRRARHVAATSLHEQRRTLYFGNRALVLMTSKLGSARER